MNALYLCYQSLSEPLTQTQVLPYLEGLTQAGHRIVLLTFEPERLSTAEARRCQRHLAAKGITWHYARYHKRPTVLATAWDIVAGVLIGLRLIRRHRVRLLHARVHVAGVMALALKRLTRARLLFDVRGLMAEEYADAGVWRLNGVLFRTTKHVERILTGAADGIVLLSEKAKELFLQWYPRETAGKPLAVIPCCVDFRHGSFRKEPTLRGASQDGTTMVYVGKLDGWYPTEAMAGLMATAIRMIPGLRWQVWTQSDAGRLRTLLAERGINGQVAIGSLAADALPMVLRRADAGLSFRRPGTSALAASPTKLGEYLAAGLPVVANSGVGDTERLLTAAAAGGGAPVGVMVREFTEDAYGKALPELMRLLNDPRTRQRCHRTARRFLDLERVGWARYRRMYDTLDHTTKGG